MPEQLFFTIEVILNGLMAGVLYSLVALGFVLIYKLLEFLIMLKELWRYLRL